MIAPLSIAAGILAMVCAWCARAEQDGWEDL